jgi:hypothetical protein
MASGLKPIVHNFPGAEQIFPADYLFNIAEEFCAHVQGHGYEPVAYRRFVEDRYPIGEKLARVNSILTQLEIEMNQQSPVDPVVGGGANVGMSFTSPLSPGDQPVGSDPVNISNP